MASFRQRGSSPSPLTPESRRPSRTHRAERATSHRIVAGLVLAALLAAGCSPGISVTVGSRQPQRDAEVRTLPTATAIAPAPGDTAPPLGAGVGQMPAAPSALFATLRSAPATALSIPAIGLTVPIQEVASTVESGVWSWPIPLDAAGHHLGTANPGEPGNIVISGHVDTREGAGVFAQLAKVAKGDTIELASQSGTFSYRVESAVVVPQSDTSVLLQVPYEQLTLITCVPDGVYHSRLVVRALPL